MGSVFAGICVYRFKSCGVLPRRPPIVFFDDTDARIAEAPYLDKGQPMLPLSLFNKIDSFLAESVPQPYTEQKPKKQTAKQNKPKKTLSKEKEPLFRVGVILIDPGHGGKDPGAVGSYTENGKAVSVREKDVVLTVSLNLYKQLKAAYPDKKILLTRNSDTFPTLEDRVNMANNIRLKKNEAILYISIHANASLNTRASGFEVWYLPQSYRRTLVDTNSTSKEVAPILNSMLEEEFTMESILIAKNILEGLDSQIGKKSKKRGLREKEWFVVRNAKMPSVLVELGFVTNPVEAKLLSTPSYLQKCATGIYNGLVSFITLFER